MTNDAIGPLGPPGLRTFVLFGLSTGAGYAIAGSALVAVTGGTPDAWGGVGLPSLVVVELVGGALAGLVVGLLAPLARRRLGAVIIVPIALFPVFSATGGLVEGFSLETLGAACVAAVLVGVPLGLRYWSLYFRYWQERPGRGTRQQ